MYKKLILAAAISTAVGMTAGPVYAQQQGQGAQSDQTWQQEQTQSQGAQIYLSTASVRQIQQSLNQQGFDVGNVDGKWNNNTSQAAQKYQRSKGLEPTGTPTIELVNSLGMGNVLQGQGGQTAQAGQNAQGQGGDMTWSQESARGQGTPLYVSTAGVRQVQQSLNQQGYDVGNIDGLWGKSTSQAAANFQRANGLEPNGKLDVNLISALGLTQQVFSAGQQGAQGGQQQGGQGQQNMAWTQESARGEGTPLWASPAVVRQIEQGLNQQGFDAGNIDGNWDNETAQAAEKFQRSKGLEPTGTLTTELLGQLGSGNWMSGQQAGRTAQTGGQQQQGTQVQGGQQQGDRTAQTGGQQGAQQQGAQQDQQEDLTAQTGGQQQNQNQQIRQEDRQVSR